MMIIFFILLLFTYSFFYIYNYKEKITDENKHANALEKIAADITRSQELRDKRLAGLPKVTYPEQLPVSQKKRN